MGQRADSTALEALEQPILERSLDPAARADELAHVIERVAIIGDLSQMHPSDRVRYYARLCESLELNPLTRPFQYVNLDGKLVLYATRDATDQLRSRRKVSVDQLERSEDKDTELYSVRAVGSLPDGRRDEATGIVSVKGMVGQTLANAYMKAETKAKRRLTLSLAGLGFLSEDEIVDTPGARRVSVDPETGAVLEDEADEAGGRSVTVQLAERVAEQRARRLEDAIADDEEPDVGEVVEGEVVEETTTSQNGQHAEAEADPPEEAPSAEEAAADAGGEVVEGAATVSPPAEVDPLSPDGKPIPEAEAAESAGAIAAEPELPPRGEGVIRGTIRVVPEKLLNFERRERPDKTIQTFFGLELEDGTVYPARATGETAELMFRKVGRGYARRIAPGALVDIVGELETATTGLYSGSSVLLVASLEVLREASTPASDKG